MIAVNELPAQAMAAAGIRCAASREATKPFGTFGSGPCPTTASGSLSGDRRPLPAQCHCRCTGQTRLHWIVASEPIQLVETTVHRSDSRTNPQPRARQPSVCSIFACSSPLPLGDPRGTQFVPGPPPELGSPENLTASPESHGRRIIRRVDERQKVNRSQFRRHAIIDSIDGPTGELEPSLTG
jgi:hypothetical protein